MFRDGYGAARSRMKRRSGCSTPRVASIFRLRLTISFLSRRNVAVHANTLRRRRRAPKETGFHMADYRKIVTANMRALIDWFGCYDAVAETINARWGGGASKGTVSKKASGQLDFTVADVIALEDAAQRYPITHLLARRLDKRNRPDTTCLITQTGIIAKESGEAISAILAAEQSSCADETAQAIAEIDEAVEALKTARARLESPKTNKGRHD